MRHGFLTLGVGLGLGVLLAAAPFAARDLTDPATAQHVLNRVAFGPRPGDVERLQRIGLQAYLDQQLRPSAEDVEAVRRRVAAFTTLSLDARTIAERFEIPALQALVAKQRRQRNTAAPGAPAEDPDNPAAAQAAKPDPGPQVPIALQPANLPMLELAQQKIIRAVYADDQLEEVLTDFWFNHFNVDARKGPTRFMLTEYERDAIRPHVLGRFRDLLGATAKSPAMLFYLDNWMSADPNGPHLEQLRPAVRRRLEGGGGRLRRQDAAPGQEAQGQGQRLLQQRRSGLNENYGRELLELHTLGVDGGYTQKDVTEVARAFTGWTIDRPRAGGGFRFVAAIHDDGEKVVLGHRIKAGGGQHDGEEVLDIVAAHPSTARFISMKLARRFVSDTPPEALVARMADTFRTSDGDLKQVMRVLLTSKEFLAPQARRAKVKTPFEFLVSALRVTDADISDGRVLVRTAQQLGMPLYQCQPPTGYKDTADTWVNTGALVNRMNVALALASGQLRGVRVPVTLDPKALLPVPVSAQTRETIARAQTPEQAVALTLGAPDFQYR
ncbi:MAG: DUF1800 domain-containing protein [Vicinamibacterales bacterium]